MMTKEEVEAAAFWDCSICLECKEPVEEEEEGTCPNCNSATVSATTVLQCLALVGEAN